MFVVYYVLSIFLSNVLAASINKNDQSIWNDFKTKNVKYAIFVEFGKGSKCFAEDDTNFGNFFEALTTGLNSSIMISSNEPAKEDDLINYQESLKNTNVTIFCQELHNKMPPNSSFSKLLLHHETCLNFCFCKSDFLKKQFPDKGCALLDYIYTKIKSEKNIENKKYSAKSSVGPTVQKVPETEIAKKTGELKQTIIDETSKSSKLPDSEVTQKKTEEVQTEAKSEIFTNKPEEKKPQLISKAVENTKDTNAAVSNVASTNEDDVNGFFTTKTEKSTEQEKSSKANNEDLIPPSPYQPDNEESYENEDETIQNTDNNVPKVEQSQSYHNINDNEYQKPVISTKYYAVQEDAGSNFFTYLFMGMFLTIVFYVIYHNKTKILALILEGRRGKSGRGRRKHTASYSKLDSNLEEAISSPYSGRSSQIIY